MKMAAKAILWGIVGFVVAALLVWDFIAKGRPSLVTGAILGALVFISSKKAMECRPVGFGEPQNQNSRCNQITTRGKCMSNETKKCPFCAEEINGVATKCRFCGEFQKNGQELAHETSISKQFVPQQSDRFPLGGLLTILLPVASWVAFMVTDIESTAGKISAVVFFLSMAFCSSVGIFYLTAGKKEGKALVIAGLAAVAFLQFYLALAQVCGE